MQPAISIENLTLNFGKFTALSEVTLIVQRGEIFGLLGPNGSGKTTLIKALCGLASPSSGKANVLGLNSYKNTDDLKDKLGYMSQSFSLYPDLTVNENINFYGEIYGMENSYLKQRREELVSLMALEPYVNRISRTLSGGLKQRLALCCAIIHEPEVVFLDEPTAAIDPVSRREIWELLFKLSGPKGITFFVTTHYMDEAEKCGRVGYLYYSKLIACGTPEELKSLPEVTPKNSTNIEINSRTPNAILTYLKTLPYVIDSTIFGQSIHALVKVDNPVEKLNKDLAQAGFNKINTTTIEPSLEDVFVRLTNNLNKAKSGKEKK